MRVVHQPAQLASHASGVFVPTMGALHEGHASLISQAARIANERGLPGGCIVSIFVNPTQFNEKADFERYPRTLEADAAICKVAGADVVFVPAVESIYPASHPISTPRLPAVASKPGLEDRSRPGHFRGVCQVVKRLFDLVSPRAAVFGEKDWQQLQVITAMTFSLRLPVEILPGATIREPDGLAMSSRNRFLSLDERKTAAAVPRALREAGRCSTPATAEHRMRLVLESAGLQVEYAVVRDARSLLKPVPGRPMRSLIAVRLGAVRLIDNAPWPRWSGAV